MLQKKSQMSVPPPPGAAPQGAPGAVPPAPGMEQMMAAAGGGVPPAPAFDPNAVPPPPGDPSGMVPPPPADMGAMGGGGGAPPMPMPAGNPGDPGAMGAAAPAGQPPVEGLDPNLDEGTTRAAAEEVLMPEQMREKEKETSGRLRRIEKSQEASVQLLKALAKQMGVSAGNADDPDDSDKRKASGDEDLEKRSALAGFDDLDPSEQNRVVAAGLRAYGNLLALEAAGLIEKAASLKE